MPIKYLTNVATLSLDRETCTGCGMCVIVCPHHVFTIEDRKARIEDLDLCMECGACMMNCPVGAVGVEKGVGCANAVIRGKLRGTEPDCGCGTPEDSGNSCCG